MTLDYNGLAEHIARARVEVRPSHGINHLLITPIELLDIWDIYYIRWIHLRWQK